MFNVCFMFIVIVFIVLVLVWVFDGDVVGVFFFRGCVGCYVAGGNVVVALVMFFVCDFECNGVVIKEDILNLIE